MALASANLATSNSASNTAEASKAEIESLLALQFSEPLPKVLARAQKSAKIMPVSEAMEKAGHKMPQDISSLLQERAVEPASSLRSLVKTQSDTEVRHSGGLSDDSTFGKAMAFINAEYMTEREKMDIKLLECGFFKLVKEKLLYETQDKLDELAMDMGLAEATMEACNGEIQKQQDVIVQLLKELAEVTRLCKATHDKLAAEKALVE